MGEGLRAGEMNRDLTPALLAIGHFLEEVNRSVNGEFASAAVRIKADFINTSFTIELDIVQERTGYVKGMYLNENLNDAHRVLEIAGFITSPISRGFIFVKKWLQGRQANITALSDGRVKLEIYDHVEFIWQEVLNLLSNPSANIAINNIVSPLEKEGIDTLEVRDSERRVAARICKADLSSFRDNQR